MEICLPALPRSPEAPSRISSSWGGDGHSGSTRVEDFPGGLRHIATHSRNERGVAIRERLSEPCLVAGFLMEGSFTAYRDSDPCRLSAGEWFLAWSGTASSTAFPRGNDLRFHSLIVDRELAADLLRDAGISVPDDREKGGVFLRRPMDPAMAGLLSRLDDDRIGPSRTMALSWSLASSALDSVEGDVPRFDVGPSRRRQLLAARDYLLSAGSAKPSLEEIARHAGLNAFQLKRDFPLQFGSTVSAYGRRYRLERARALLRSTDMTVTRIALEAGWDHPGKFSAAFSGLFGETPREYRNGKTDQE